MPEITVKGYAKLNLTLDVLRRRDDGYHDLKMIMQSIEFCDEITIKTAEHISVKTNLGYLPTDSRNTAGSAAELFFRTAGINGGVSVGIDKKIPVCAGLGGGSADAAAVLRGLRGIYAPDMPIRRLAEIGAGVGSDVPYCVMGGTMLAEGRGERLTPLPPLPDCHVVLCKPPVYISTPTLFSQIDVKKIKKRPDTDGAAAALESGDLAGLSRRMYNVFEELVAGRHREIAEIKRTMIDGGALGACMTGTGPTVFGLFDDAQAARRVFAKLRSGFKDTFLSRARADSPLF